MPNPYEDYGLLNFLRDAHILSGGPMTRLKHGAYPDIIKREIERQYPDIGPRVDRGVLDMAINYAGGYDWAARSGLDPQITKEQARAYQYMDYGDRPEDSIQDYYENFIRKRIHCYFLLAQSNITYYTYNILIKSLPYI